MDLRINGARSPYEIYRTKNLAAISRTRRTSTKDDAVVSSKGKDYQTALKALRDVPDVRQEKIDSIQTKIESGLYDVSSKDVAGKLLGLI